MIAAIVLALAACSSPEPDAPQDAEASVPEEKAAAPAMTQVVVASRAGPVVIQPIYHGTVRLEIGNQVWWIDPWSKAKLPDTPEANVVLITDIHQDHMDAAALAKVAVSGATVIAPRAVADALPGKVRIPLENGGQTEIGPVKVTAVPMYNLSRGPEPGTRYHERGRGNGYLLDIADARIYIAGDTACTGEMKGLSEVDVALIPMNLPYTMNTTEAAECVAAFKPKRVVPYHYAGSDVDAFAGALADGPTEVVRIDAYPGGLPW